MPDMYWEQPEPPEYYVRDAGGNTIMSDMYPGTGDDVYAVAKAPEDIAFLIGEVERLQGVVDAVNALRPQWVEAIQDDIIYAEHIKEALGSEYTD